MENNDLKKSEKQSETPNSKSAPKELVAYVTLEEFRENWLVEIEQKYQSKPEYEKLVIGEDAAANDDCYR